MPNLATSAIRYKVPQFVYVLPISDAFCKIGMWTGSIKKLRARYRTSHHSALVNQMVVFQCDDARKMEKQLFEHCKLLHAERELYDLYAIEMVQVFCKHFCYPFVCKV